jgi:DNA-binding Lrp family transcriptional regulator
MSQTLARTKLHELCTAYIMITCETGFEEPIIEEIKSIDGVTEVQSIFGAYDIILKIELPTVESLRDTITHKIRKISKIRTTTTVVCESPHL